MSATITMRHYLGLPSECADLHEASDTIPAPPPAHDDDASAPDPFLTYEAAVLTAMYEAQDSGDAVRAAELGGQLFGMREWNEGDGR